MLVLTRKIQEKIRISDDITVTILRIKGSTVRLGIEAPRDVRVIRGELAEQNDAHAAQEKIQVASARMAELSMSDEAAHADDEDANTAEQLSDPERKRRAVLQVLRIAELTHCGA